MKLIRKADLKITPGPAIIRFYGIISANMTEAEEPCNGYDHERVMIRSEEFPDGATLAVAKHQASPGDFLKARGNPRVKVICGRCEQPFVDEDAKTAINMESQGESLSEGNQAKD